MELIEAYKIENCKTIPIDINNVNQIKEIKDLATEMAMFCSKEGGVGLSACQIGLFKSFFVMKMTNNSYSVIINPSYYKEGSRYLVTESCLSYPNEAYDVKRYKSIKVHYWTIENNGFTFVENKMKGEIAEIFQHETDHGNGKTIAMIGKKR